jgi:hypothetical protein
MKKRLFALVICICNGIISYAQELNARVVVNASQIGTNVDRRVFTDMQKALNTFVNGRKWTNEVYTPVEKINCNFIITIKEARGNNTFVSELSIQSARPIFNSTYNSPQVRYQDPQFTFKYVEFQPIEFNENRIQGNDPLTANLPATLAYYVYIILGLDYSSFNNRAGDVFFQKALNISNNAPDGAGIEGWRAFDGQRNRYWLIENLTNTRYAAFHDVLYNYYRRSMDFVYENEAQARTEMINVLIYLNNLYAANISTMIIPFFMQAKYREITNLFKKGNSGEKIQAMQYLKTIDGVNANFYSEELK